MRPGNALAITILTLVLLAVAAVSAWPHPGSEGEWLRGLMIPGTRSSCCNEMDCATAPASLGADGTWTVQTPGGDAVPVPRSRIIQDQAHPSGAAVLCWRPGGGVICFVPPAGGG